MSIYNINTEAGKALWQKINQEHGSAVWGAVGDGIEAIEAEVEARIIKLLEDKDEELIGIISCWFDYGLEHQSGRAYKNRAIKIIKGEK